MTILQSLVLGIVQGITEFLPISSSAHLVLVPFLFNWHFPAEQIFPFDVLVQLGTLLAVFAYFWRDLIDIIRCFFIALSHGRPFESPEARLGWYLIVSAIPASIVGLLIKERDRSGFQQPRTGGRVPVRNRLVTRHCRTSRQAPAQPGTA